MNWREQVRMDLLVWLADRCFDLRAGFERVAIKCDHLGRSSLRRQTKLALEVSTRHVQREGGPWRIPS